jgi:hypothetical protein
MNQCLACLLSFDLLVDPLLVLHAGVEDSQDQSLLFNVERYELRWESSISTADGIDRDTEVSLPKGAVLCAA